MVINGSKKYFSNVSGCTNKMYLVDHGRDSIPAHFLNVTNERKIVSEVFLGVRLLCIVIFWNKYFKKCMEIFKMKLKLSITYIVDNG